jgi:hypothetical protein
MTGGWSDGAMGAIRLALARRYLRFGPKRNLERMVTFAVL